MKILKLALPSAASGLLLALSFPKLSLGLLAWVALVPLLLALSQTARLLHAAIAGFTTGIVFFAAVLYWIPRVLTDFGGMALVLSAAVYLLFASLLALFTALFSAGAWMLLHKASAAEALGGIPALWVALELLRAHIFTGFPWLLVGYALTDHLVIAQLARWGGVYLLSFLAVLFPAGIALMALRPTRARKQALAAAFLALALATAAGARVDEPRAASTAYLVQAQVPLTGEWTHENLDTMLSDLEQRVTAAWARNQSRAGVIVFPEMPAPMYADDDRLLARMGRLARQTASPVVANLMAFADPERRQVYNSAVAFGLSGLPSARYDKIQLVPFGEYVPWKSVFFFMEKITTEVGDFRAGDAPVLLPANGTRLGALICYENIFPDLVRRFTAAGAGVLLNLSNDGWYGQSAAREQLLLMSRLRAVENGRWMLRATNTGITAVIDPWGRARTFPAGTRAVYPVKYEARQDRTVFVAFGHWFSWVCAAAATALVARACRGPALRVAAVVEDTESNHD